MSAIQHIEARKLLAVISSAVTTHRDLTYQTAAEEIGRDPAKNSRMVAQICDLLDAAAALAGVPLLALVMVREKSGDINRKAWAGPDAKLGRRKRIIDNSLAHRFTSEDFRAIDKALDKLTGKSNRTAWAFVRKTLSREQLDRNLEGSKSSVSHIPDAIDDIGSDAGIRKESIIFTYARDPKIRRSVMVRAGGRCEFCGIEGFMCENGERYLESHHIIALAADGADRMTNVIALCPSDHREAHFGKRRFELEEAMILKVRALESGKVTG